MAARVRGWAPRSSRASRLLLASLIWTGIGAGLLAAATRWLVTAPSAGWLAAAPLAMGVGWAKGRFVLAPRAEANARRIEASGDGRCLGGVFSWASWVLAAGMMAGGWALRHSAVPRPWLGLLYGAAGTALLAASAGSWRRWRLFRRTSQPASSA